MVIFSRYGAIYEQFHLDNREKDWDNYYVLDEGAKLSYYFDEIHLTRNASLRMKTGDGQNRTVKVNKFYGDGSGRMHTVAGHTAFYEEYQTQTKYPVNIWLDDGSKAYMAPLVYILGQGKIAFRWNGQTIYLRYLRIVPGRVIEIDQNAMTSYMEGDEYKRGTPGAFTFAGFELGKGATLQLPPPMEGKMTAGLVVSNIISHP